jgi:hypothetical protein
MPRHTLSYGCQQKAPQRGAERAEKGIMRTININDYVEVQLTAAGIQMLTESYAVAIRLLGISMENVIQKKTVDGWTRFQIHELMHVFGPACFNGSNRLPFVDNLIKFDD